MSFLHKGRECSIVYRAVGRGFRKTSQPLTANMVTLPPLWRCRELCILEHSKQVFCDIAALPIFTSHDASRVCSVVHCRTTWMTMFTVVMTGEIMEVKTLVMMMVVTGEAAG